MPPKAKDVTRFRRDTKYISNPPTLLASSVWDSWGCTHVRMSVYIVRAYVCVYLQISLDISRYISIYLIFVLRKPFEGDLPTASLRRFRRSGGGVGARPKILKYWVNTQQILSKCLINTQWRPSKYLNEYLVNTEWIPCKYLVNTWWILSKYLANT